MPQTIMECDDEDEEEGNFPQQPWMMKCGSKS